MGSFVIVGRLPNAEAHDDARAFLAAACDARLTSDTQAQLLQQWRAAPEQVSYLDPLNLASQASFLNHAVTLEGLKDVNEAMCVADGGTYPTGSKATGHRCRAT